MRVVRDHSFLPESCKRAVVALGNFDGLHCGHRIILQETMALAKATGRKAALLTFEPHPRRILRPGLPPLRIMSLTQKIGLLRDWGMDFLHIVRFSTAFAQISAETFIREKLMGELQVSHIVTGEDFIFGHNREGNAAYLLHMARVHRFGYTACPPVRVAGNRVSSTLIREALSQGNMQRAAQYLGRAYSIMGKVREGDKRGRQLGFPTANILPGALFLPRFGVYAVRCVIGGKPVHGVANFGVRPTFGGERPQLEAHFFDWQDSLYGQRLLIELVHFIRDEATFASLDALKAQIAQDSLEAQAFLAGTDSAL